MRDQDQHIYELTAQVDTLTDSLNRLLSQLSQSSPSVSGKASALVALAKDARMDGRVGAGDVTVSVMLAGGGFSIGVIGAAGVWLGGIDFISTGEMLGFCTLSGCALGILRMSIDALAIPVMLSNLMDWLEGRWLEWLEYKAEIANSGPKIVERPVIINPQEDDKMPWEHYDSPMAARHITVKKETARSDAVSPLYGKLWYFIEDCFNRGEWARDKVVPRWRERFGQGALPQREHKAIYDFLKKQFPPDKKRELPGLWGLTGENNRPTLHAYLERLGWSPNELTS